MKDRRAYDIAYRKTNIHRVLLVQRARQRRIRALLDGLKNKPCADCDGWFEPCQMDFDHRPGTRKLFSISMKAHSNGRETLLREIKKCDVVCSNCHRLRTRRRKQYAPTPSRYVHLELDGDKLSSGARANGYVAILHQHR